jgi:hypothetical protein
METVMETVIKIAKLGVSRLVTETAYHSRWKRLGYTIIEEPKPKPKKAKPVKKEEAPQPKKKDTPKKSAGTKKKDDTPKE